jgi:hypothetical protein
MRYWIGFVFVVALAVMGCSETGGVPRVCESHGDCDDGNACTDDYCQGLVDDEGVCANAPHECPDDLSDCTPATCDPASGCEPAADGTLCAGGACQSGVCELAGSVLP